MDKNKKKEVKGTDIAVSLILGFIIVIVPLIIRLAEVSTSADELKSVRSSAASNDIFIYCKSWAIILAVILLLIFLALDLLTDYKKKKIYFKHPLMLTGGIYGIFVILSTLFSSYGSVVLKGVTERYEGAVMLLCYIALFMIMFHFVKNVKKVNFFFGALMLSTFIIGLIGVGQFFGFDIFTTDLAARLVYGSQYREGVTLSVKYDTVYSVLYNPNCVGSFFALMLPVFLVPALLLPLKNKLKYCCIVLTVISVINTIGSGSAGGLLGLSSSAVVIIIAGIFCCIKKGMLKGVKPIALAGFAAGAVVLCIVIGAVMVKTDSQAFQRVYEKVQVIFNTVSGKTVQESPYFWRDLKTEGNKAVISTAYYDFELYMEDGEPVLAIDGEKLDCLTMSEEDGLTTYLYEDESGKEDRVPFLEQASVVLADDIIKFEGYDGFSKTGFMFRETEDGLTAVTSKYDNYDLNTEVKHIGFEGLEYLGSSRGYIWSRSLPLIFKPKNFVIGSGPDTFAMEFPQTDLLGKTKYLGNPYVIVDKPHNMYIQTAVNTGAFSLIAFLALVVIYFFSTIKTVLKSENRYLNIIRIALLWGILAYLAAGISTDSTVGVAPFYWIILGLGCSLNKADFSENSEEAIK